MLCKKCRIYTQTVNKIDSKEFASADINKKASAQLDKSFCFWKNLFWINKLIFFSFKVMKHWRDVTEILDQFLFQGKKNWSEVIRFYRLNFEIFNLI